MTLTQTPVVNVLLHIYAVHAWPESAQAPSHSRSSSTADAGEGPSHYRHPANGRLVNGHARSASENQHVHDAEEFELQGLISDEEDDAKPLGDDGHPMGPRKVEDEENSPLVAKETSTR